MKLPAFTELQRMSDSPIAAWNSSSKLSFVCRARDAFLGDGGTATTRAKNAAGSFFGARDRKRATGWTVIEDRVLLGLLSPCATDTHGEIDEPGSRSCDPLVPLLGKSRLSPPYPPLRTIWATRSQLVDDNLPLTLDEPPEPPDIWMNSVDGLQPRCEWGLLTPQGWGQQFCPGQMRAWCSVGQPVSGEAPVSPKN